MTNIESVISPGWSPLAEHIDDAYAEPERVLMLHVARRLPSETLESTARAMYGAEAAADRVINAFRAARRHRVSIPSEMFDAAITYALGHEDTEEWDIPSLRSFQDVRS